MSDINLLKTRLHRTKSSFFMRLQRVMKLPCYCPGCGRSIIWLFVNLVVIYVLFQLIISKHLLFSMRSHSSNNQSEIINESYSAPSIFHLKEDNQKYFLRQWDSACFISGSESDRTSQSCQCKAGWWGEHCSFPEDLRTDKSLTWKNVIPRSVPRRVIFAVPFNIEFDLTEVRLHELADVVDVFMFGESNYSSHGDPKSLRLLEALRSGFAEEYHNKILYVFLDHFDQAGVKDGWVAEALMRNHLGEHGVKTMLSGTRPDDLIILTDADEIPKREILLFLKNHDGIQEPFGFTLNAFTYTFYWSSGKEGKIAINGGCTLGMLHHVLQYKIYFLRNPQGKIFGSVRDRLTAYKTITTTTFVRHWIIGERKVAVGWHCSYCFTPELISLKLTSAQNGDFPRWGDYPGKLSESYIAGLIVSGRGFNEKRCCQTSPIDEAHVPRYVLENPTRFNHLLNRSFYGNIYISPSRPSIKRRTKTKRIVRINR